MALSVEERQLLAHAGVSLKVTATLLFPGRFSRPFDLPHEEVMSVLEDPSYQYIVIVAPRGIGKTSISNLLLPANDILFAKADYIVQVSNSSTVATQQSENLKRELLTNPTIRKWFGDVSAHDDVMNKEQWVATVGGHQTCIMPRGAGQQVRGMLWRDHRPDRIIIDDLEDRAEIHSEENRKKIKDWFWEDLYNCVDRGKDKHFRFVYLDTLKHEQSLIVNLLEDTEWKGIKIEICNDLLETNFPNFISTEEIKKVYARLQRQGKVDGFYREFRGMANPQGEDAVFQSRFFQYYDEGAANLNHTADNFAIIDPARTKKSGSADTAIVVAAYDRASKRIYIRDVYAGKAGVPELLQELMFRIPRFNIRTVAVEVTGLHEFVLHPLKNELARNNFNVIVEELHARGGVEEKGKHERVRSLSYYYRTGLVYHNQANCEVLEAQLLSFPRPRRWDVMDATGYITELLEKNERYMGEYDGAMASREEVMAEYDQYNQSNDMFELGNWRPY